MVRPWTYKNTAEGIDESAWLRDYIVRYYRGGSIQEFANEAIVNFCNNFPMTRRIINRKLETEEEMERRYELLPSVSCHHLFTSFSLTHCIENAAY